VVKGVVLVQTFNAVIPHNEPGKREVVASPKEFLESVGADIKNHGRRKLRRREIAISRGN
jgi:hypothetical protein